MSLVECEHSGPVGQFCRTSSLVEAANSVTLKTDAALRGVAREKERERERERERAQRREEGRIRCRILSRPQMSSGLVPWQHLQVETSIRQWCGERTTFVYRLSCGRGGQRCWGDYSCTVTVDCLLAIPAVKRARLPIMRAIMDFSKK